MLDDFFVCVILVGIGVVIVVVFLGCFVVWWCMVYFGDVISYVVIFGIVLVLVLNIFVFIGVLVIVLVMVLIVMILLD